jgi:hypothetical protein
MPQNNSSARPGYTENWLPVVVAVFPGFLWTKLYVPSSCTCDVCDLICPRQEMAVRSPVGSPDACVRDCVLLYWRVIVWGVLLCLRFK